VSVKRAGNGRKLIFGTGLVISTFGAGAVAGAVMAPAAAVADTTCYTGCTPIIPPNDGGTTVQPVTTSDAGLPFTGGDVEQLAAIGGGAVLLGGLLIRRRRRANAAAATSAVSGLVAGDTTVGSQWRPDSPTTRG
jgi:LPXTG-motif cell wall-anchored protein